MDHSPHIPRVLPSLRKHGKCIAVAAAAGPLFAHAGGAVAWAQTAFVELGGAGNPFGSIARVGPVSPALHDVDGDGDLDLFLGDADGAVHYYENTGSETSPAFTERTGAANPLDDVSASSAGLALLAGAGSVGGEHFPAVGKQAETSNAAFPFLADLDGDLDLDAFIGSGSGAVSYWENTGSPVSPAYTQRTGGANPLSAVSAAGWAMPAGADTDGDLDVDMFIGDTGDDVLAYANTGAPASPSFTRVTGAANALDGVAGGPATFVDLDEDGDMDYLAGSGALRYFENTGSADSPEFTLRTGDEDPFDGLVSDPHASPTFGDLDGDGDLNLCVGTEGGRLRYFSPIDDPVPPEADAGADAVVTEGATVTLDGGDSLPDAKVATRADDLTYEWTQIAGPSVALSQSTAATTTFTAPQVDEEGAGLGFRLTVTDTEQLADTDDVWIYVTEPFRDVFAALPLPSAAATAAAETGLAEPDGAVGASVPSAVAGVWGDPDEVRGYLGLPSDRAVIMLGPTEFTYAANLANNQRAVLAWAVSDLGIDSGARTDDMSLFKILADGSVQEFSYGSDPATLADPAGGAGLWCVRAADGEGCLEAGDRMPRERMVLTVYLNAGGPYDLDSKADAVTDPLVLAGPDSDFDDGPGGGGGGGGGGCVAGGSGEPSGWMPLVLAAFASLGALVRRLRRNGGSP